MVLVVMVAMLNLTMGCNRDAATTSDPKQTASVGYEVDRRFPTAISLWVSDALGDGEVTVTLYDAVRVDDDRVDVFYSYAGVNGTSSERRLRMKATDIENESSITCRVFDETGILKVGVRVAADIREDTVFVINEWTDQDSLTIERKIDSDRVFEQYDFNGNKLQVSFTQEEIERWLFTESAGEPDWYESAARVVPYPQTEPHFPDFSLFYGDGGTLELNHDGFILISLVASEAFESWLTMQLGTFPSVNGTKKMSVEAMCEIASMATFKCYFPMPGNFVCYAAIGVSGACAVYSVWKWFQ